MFCQTQRPQRIQGREPRYRDFDIMLEPKQLIYFIFYKFKLFV